MHQNPRRNDDDDGLEKPEHKPSLLTARELQARDPGKMQPDEEKTGERHGSADFRGPKGEPHVTDETPARSKKRK